MRRGSSWARTRAVASLALGAALLAALVGCVEATPDSSVQARVRGGDGGALPQAEPSSEGLEPQALEEAARVARSQGASSLLVLRRGHLVLERYWDGVTAETRLDSGELAQLALALATGIAVNEGRLGGGEAREAFDRYVTGAEVAPEYLRAATRERYSDYLGERLWAPLAAAEARLQLEPRTLLPEGRCCLVARHGDWLRLAELMMNDGVFQGERVLPPAWVAWMLRPGSGPGRGMGIQLAAAASGEEPFATSGVVFARGAHGSRLWLVPRLRLAALMTRLDGEEPVDDTTVPNVLLRGLTGQRDPADGHPLVPGH